MNRGSIEIFARVKPSSFTFASRTLKTGYDCAPHIYANLSNEHTCFEARVKLCILAGQIRGKKHKEFAGFFGFRVSFV